MVTGTVHAEAVPAVKARTKATMILLVRRDMQLPPFVLNDLYEFVPTRVT
jgi:hypothetical protein